MLRLLALAALAVGLFGMNDSPVASQDKTDAKKPKPEDLAKTKKALQEVQDFIGLWNLEGTQKEGPKTVAWKEKVSWGWKFKDGDAWMKRSQEMIDTGLAAWKAAEAKNVDQLFTIGGDIYEACSHCHQEYMDAIKNANQ